VVGYDPFSLCEIHKEGLCPSSGNINRLMLMMIKYPDLIQTVYASNVFTYENVKMTGRNFIEKILRVRYRHE
jgi:hypothetical protein